MTIEEIGRKQCSGCSLCSRICPKNSISMKADEEGFLMPIIDHTVCIDCGLCYKECPCNKDSTIEPISPTYYTSAIKDRQDLQNSSSGGIFIALARYILSKGGLVCGCVYNLDMESVHICTDSIEDVKRMMGSKYVQSNIVDILPLIKKHLAEGKTIMFTGTACQCAAVKSYTKDLSKLYLVDILCHGVPSPLFFHKYIEFLEKKHNGKVINIEFRNKKELGWGSEHRTYYEINKKGRINGYRPNLPAYFCSFFWGLNLRESCYNCKFAGKDRISDITIGDFWGYWSYFLKDFPEGISIASVNTQKGKLLFDYVKNYMNFCIELPEDNAKGTNTNFYYPTSRPLIRDTFYKNIYNLEYKDFIWKTYLEKSCRKKMIKSIYGCFVPECIKAVIRRNKKDRNENICNNTNI